MFASCVLFVFFFFNDTATTEIYTLSLHDALPIRPADGPPSTRMAKGARVVPRRDHRQGWGRLANARHEMEPTDAPVVGDALHVVVITGRTRHAEQAHPFLRQEAHPIKRTPLGQHGKEPRGAARVHDAAGARQT